MKATTVRAILILCAALVAVSLAARPAEATRFGRNKVQYRSFEWKIIHTEHFDVYFYDGSEDLADAASRMVEEANAEFERVLGHELTTVIPVIVYASHNDFQQTNVSASHVSESVGGFTELFKNRVVVPFTGSYSDLRHVIYHELTHVFTFDIVYGGLVESVIRQASMNPVPLWFAEGLSEYVSTGWDSEAEMILRDLTVSDLVIPINYLYGGYLVYKEGQSVMNFIAERYGEEKIAEMVRHLARTKSLDRSLKESIGLTPAELSAEWEKWLKARYWPSVADLGRGEDIARLVTAHRKDGSYFNIGPAVSPDGTRVVYLSDKSGYPGAYVASTLDGRVLHKLFEGERSDEFEQLHILRVGFSWSPDGTRVCFVAKAGAHDVIHIVDAETGRVESTLSFDLDGLFTPAWSPTGDRLAFVGTRYGASDLYVCATDGSGLTRLTDDFHDEREPSWSPDGRLLAFASDRGSPVERGFERIYDLYLLDVETRSVTPLVTSHGNESSPSWSSDGERIIYSSDIGGTPDLYLANLADSTSVRLTSLVGGAESPSWAARSDWVAFSHYGDGGWDVAIIKDPVERLADVIEAGPHRASLGPREAPAVQAEPESAPPVAARVDAPSGVVESVPASPPAVSAEPDTAGTDTGRAAGTIESDVFVVDRTRSQDAVSEESDTVRRVRREYSRAVNGDEANDGEDDRDEAEIERYRPRFSPDWIDGGVSYSSAYGFGGQTQIAVSDILGDHRFYLATDFFSSIEASNLHLQYEYLARRTNIGASIFSYKDYYYSERTALGEDLGEKRYFTERSYGLSTGLSYPFSKFTRVEVDLTALNMTRRYAEENEEGIVEFIDEEVSRTLALPSVRLINDTTIWGSVGPIGGGRSSIVLSKAEGLDTTFDYLTAIVDVRRYLRMGTRHSLALKLVGARSSQADAQNFYIGGINSLRGYDDFEFHGHNIALATVEWRYPFIDRLDMAAPLPLSLWGLRGILFFDVGAAWDDDFRGLTREGGTRLKDLRAAYGVGVRMNLGMFVIRVDTAWPTDLQDAGDKKTHFALGAEF